MSFFMLSMPDAGLRSRPPVSKHTPLPTSVTLGSLSLPQVRSISRGARVLARPTAWIIGKFCFSRSSPTDDLDLGAVLLGELLRRGRELDRPHVGRRRGDEIARQADRFDHRRRARLVGALRPQDLRPGLALLRLVALEAPRPETDRDGGVGRRHRRGVAELPRAGWQFRAERAEVPQGRLGREHKHCTARLAVAARAARRSRRHCPKHRAIRASRGAPRSAPSATTATWTAGQTAPAGKSSSDRRRAAPWTCSRNCSAKKQHCRPGAGWQVRRGVAWPSSRS